MSSPGWCWPRAAYAAAFEGCDGCGDPLCSDSMCARRHADDEAEGLTQDNPGPDDGVGNERA